MKTISNDLAAHLVGEVTSLATCWKLTRRDAAIMGFTSHDQNLLIEGVTYEATTGFTPTAIAATASLSVDNLDVEGMISSGAITEADLMAGLYDFAEIEIFQVNYTDLSQGIIKLHRGWLGEIVIRNKQFVAEVRGLTQKLSQTIGELYSPACRAQLGDSRCKVNLAVHTVTGSIDAVTSNQQFSDSGRSEEAGLFAAGIITFTSGANTGLSMEIKEHRENGVFILTLPMPYNVDAGDGYSLTEGCDKSFPTCAQRFNNALNFRGEPHVPGIDRMLETAGTRSEW